MTSHQLIVLNNSCLSWLTVHVFWSHQCFLHLVLKTRFFRKFMISQLKIWPLTKILQMHLQIYLMLVDLTHFRLMLVIKKFLVLPEIFDPKSYYGNWLRAELQKLCADHSRINKWKQTTNVGYEYFATSSPWKYRPWLENGEILYVICSDPLPSMLFCNSCWNLFNLTQAEIMPSSMFNFFSRLNKSATDLAFSM